MGFPLDLFVHPPGKSYICSICTEVAREAVILRNCEHLFCKQCITQWIERVDGSKDCPDCREGPLTGDDLIRPPRVFRQMFNELEVKCSVEGCTVVCELEKYDEHRKHCPKTPCNLGCGAFLLKEDLPNHVCVEYWKAVAENRDPKQVEVLNGRLANLTVNHEELKESYRKLLNYSTALKSYLVKFTPSEKVDLAQLNGFTTGSLEIKMTVTKHDLKITSGAQKTVYSPYHSLHGVPWCLAISMRDDDVVEAHIVCHDNRPDFSHEVLFKITAKAPGGSVYGSDKDFGIFTETTRTHGTTNFFYFSFCGEYHWSSANCSYCSYGPVEFVALIKPMIPIISFEKFLTAQN